MTGREDCPTCLEYQRQVESWRRNELKGDPWIAMSSFFRIYSPYVIHVRAHKG